MAPSAGTALAPPPESTLGRRRPYRARLTRQHVTISGTSVKSVVTVFMTRPAAAIVGQLTMLWIKSGVSSAEGRRPLFPRERPHRYIALSDVLGQKRPKCDA